MKFTRHSYIYAFERAERLFDKVYYEVELEVGDTIEDAERLVLERCKQRASEISGDNQYPYSGIQMPSGEYSVPFNNNPPPPKEEERIGVLASDIESCTNLKILETYRFIKETKPELKKAYDKRYEELKNQNNG